MRCCHCASTLEMTWMVLELSPSRDPLPSEFSLAASPAGGCVRLSYLTLLHVVNPVLPPCLSLCCV